MNFTCNECNDTGSRDKLGTYLDCNACGTASMRRDLNDFVKSLGPTHPEDVALAIHQRALAMAPKQEEPAQEPFHHYGLGAETLQQLLDGCLKPEEISGADDVQHDRVHELVWWFARLTQGNANAKWAVRHACELAYFVATNGVNRCINLKAIRDAAFKEGVNITQEERGTLERIGFAIPRAISIAAPAVANGALADEQIIQIITEAKIHCVHPSAATTLDIARAILAAAGPDAALVSLIHKAQSILAKHLPPDGPDEKTTISALLGLLDGPESRAALSGAKGD